MGLPKVYEFSLVPRSLRRSNWNPLEDPPHHNESSLPSNHFGSGSYRDRLHCETNAGMIFILLPKILELPEDAVVVMDV